jgi:hypothetical protein
MKTLSFLLFNLFFSILLFSEFLSLGQVTIEKNIYNDPPLTGEFQVDPSMIYNSVPFGVGECSMAFNGKIYLIVWSDHRNNDELKVYGARLDTEGNLLDPVGFLICNIPGEQYHPNVSTNGDIFLVTWDYIDFESDTYQDIYAARVKDDKTVLDPGGIIICDAPGEQDFPKVASVGEDFCIVWADSRPGFDSPHIYGTFVSSSGAVSHPAGLPICTSYPYQESPDICADGLRYFIVWKEFQNIGGLFLYPDGTVSQENGHYITLSLGIDSEPSVCWGGSQFFLAWEIDESGSRYKIYGSRIDNQGYMIDDDIIEISGVQPVRYYGPDVSSDGSNFMVTYYGRYQGIEDHVDVLVRRLGADGHLLDPDQIVIYREEYYNNLSPSILYNGNDYLLTWQDHQSGNAKLYGTFVDPSGIVNPVDGFQISYGYNGQFDGKAASDGSNYMVIWCDTRNENLIHWDIYASKINQQGIVQQQNPTPIVTDEKEVENPAIEFNGIDYLIAWDSRDGLRGARVDPDGNLIGDDFFITSLQNLSNSPFDIASDGQNWLIVFCDDRDDNQFDTILCDIYGVIVNADGTIKPPGDLTLLSHVGNQKEPYVIFDGTDYVVVYVDYRNDYPDMEDIYGFRVTPEGNVIDTDGVEIVDNDILVMYDPVLSFDSTNYLLCWVESAFSGDLQQDIKGLRFNRQFELLDTQPIIIADGPGDQTVPSLTYCDGKYMVLWMDESTGTNVRIGSTFISPAGTILQKEIFSENEYITTNPFITRGPEKEALAVFSKYIDNFGETQVNAVRLMGKLAGQVQEPGISEQDGNSVMNARIWPVPASDILQGWFTLVNTKDVNIFIYDAAGKVIKELKPGELSKGEHEFNTSVEDWLPGVYFVNIKAGNDGVTLKVVVK